MKIVIDVPEKLILEGFERPFTEEEKNILIKAIGNGTSLPIGHGRLIDINELITKLEVWDYKANGIPNYVWKCIKDAQTIIEADKGESEEI